MIKGGRTAQGHDHFIFVRAEKVGRVKKHPNKVVISGIEVTELAFEDGWEQWFEAEWELDKARMERAWAKTIKDMEREV